jgi:hypothetical protein
MKTTTTETASEKADKSMILGSIAHFIAQPPRLEVGNYVSYGDNGQGWRALRQERRSITRDLKTAKFLLPMVQAQVPLGILLESFRAYSGRLEWNGTKLEYTAGQYFPTEYRKAACAVLSQALWTTWRESGLSPRDTATRTLPKTVASWFN